MTTTQREDIDKTKIYSNEDAIRLAKNSSKVKFDASIEVHVKLGIDPKKSDQQIRSVVALPHGTGKTQRIIAFVDQANEKVATEAGADIVGGDQLIEKMASSGKIDFDVAVAVPSMMPKLAKIAKILGPKGLMPNPKSETVSPDIAKTITALKKGKAAFKSDDTGNIHIAIGKCSFTTEQLIENFAAFVEILKKSKPSSTKGNFIESVTISSSMGPGIKTSI